MCLLGTLKEPARPEIFLYMAATVLIVAFAVVILIELFIRRSRPVDGTRLMETRIYSLDAFRGISLFWMIFFNYGSGGYKFLQHADWHGITPAGTDFFRYNFYFLQV